MNKFVYHVHYYYKSIMFTVHYIAINQYLLYIIFIFILIFLFKEILVQDLFFMKYSLQSQYFELDYFCLPPLMMIDIISKARREIT